MLLQTEMKKGSKNLVFLLAVGLATVGGLVLWSGSAEVRKPLTLTGGFSDRPVEIETADYYNAGTDDPLWLCVDDCCKKLQPKGDDPVEYSRGSIQYLQSDCVDEISDKLMLHSSVKLVASGGNAWMGNLVKIGIYEVWEAHNKQLLSTDPNKEMNGMKAKRGVSFKWEYHDDYGYWTVDEDAPVPFNFYMYPWNVQLTTSDVAMAGTDDSLLFCVDDCCEKLNNIGEDNYERGNTDHFVSNCRAPTDASTIKLVASGGDAWMGNLLSIYGQPVEYISQPLVLSTESSDAISGIQAKHGVTFKKQADGEWHYAADVPFDYFVWNVEIDTKDVSKAAMDGSLRFCVDDCCEKLNNDGEDNYERGRIDHFRSNCKAPTDASTLKLIATNGDGWMGKLRKVYGAKVDYYPLVLSTQSSDEIDGTKAKRGATFIYDGHIWRWHSSVPY